MTEFYKNTQKWYINYHVKLYKWLFYHVLYFFYAIFAIDLDHYLIFTVLMFLMVHYCLN